ncbi:MAG: tRNA 5-methoxyuridine(34)/uridine 5-oxyacetic acid(34) synthase CmoB [Phycisphaerae bacterium]
MNHYESFFQYIAGRLPDAAVSHLKERAERILREPGHGDFDAWLESIASFPALPAGKADFTSDAVTCGTNSLPAQDKSVFTSALMRLHPWRKGPFCLHGVYIDTEWRSCMKWDRIVGQIAPLEGRKVLDIGCGNGYYGYRMLGAGAEFVLGIDPTMLFVAQSIALNKAIGESRNAVLPLGIDELPEQMKCFDTVFSMGVLYHRRDPVAHIKRLAGTVRSGGQVVLETIVIDEEPELLFIPKGRYAKMRNLWNLASPAMITGWLEKAGLKNVRLVDKTLTTTAEQRKTDWMTFESLADFLNPADHTHTIEGLPAPVRAVFVGEV